MRHQTIIMAHARLFHAHSNGVYASSILLIFCSQVGSRGYQINPRAGPTHNSTRSCALRRPTADVLAEDATALVRKWASDRRGWRITSMFLTASNLVEHASAAGSISRFLQPAAPKQQQLQQQQHSSGPQQPAADAAGPSPGKALSGDSYPRSGHQTTGGGGSGGGVRQPSRTTSSSKRAGRGSHKGISNFFSKSKSKGTPHPDVVPLTRSPSPPGPSGAAEGTSGGNDMVNGTPLAAAPCPPNPNPNPNPIGQGPSQQPSQDALPLTLQDWAMPCSLSPGSSAPGRLDAERRQTDSQAAAAVRPAIHRDVASNDVRQAVVDNALVLEAPPSALAPLSADGGVTFPVPGAKMPQATFSVPPALNASRLIVQASASALGTARPATDVDPNLQGPAAHPLPATHAAAAVRSAQDVSFVCVSPTAGSTAPERPHETSAAACDTRPGDEVATSPAAAIQAAGASAAPLSPPSSSRHGASGPAAEAWKGIDFHNIDAAVLHELPVEIQWELRRAAPPEAALKPKQRLKRQKREAAHSDISTFFKGAGA